MKKKRVKVLIIILAFLYLYFYGYMDFRLQSSFQGAGTHNY